MKKLVIALSLMLSLAVAPSAAFASTGQQATLAGNFHITYDGVEQDFTDGNGSEVEPIVLDGTTYLPVRAVSNIAGLNVNWDASTKTVSLTSGSAVTAYDGTPSNTKVSSITVSPDSSIVIALNGQQQVSYVNGKPIYPFIYEGTTYLPVRAVCNMVSIPVDWDSVTKTVVLGAKSSSTVTSPAAVTTSSAAVTTNSAVSSIPKDAKVLTDKDVIPSSVPSLVTYENGTFNIIADAYTHQDQSLDFNTNGYKTVTFTVTTNDADDRSKQRINVIGRDTADAYGKTLALDVYQEYGVTKTYTANISDCKVGEIRVSAGGFSNATLTNVYLSR